MPTNQESLNNDLYRLLSKYKPKPLDASGKITPIPDEADVFKFEFTKDGEEYGTVYATIDEDRVLTVYFGDDVANSPKGKTPGLDYDDSWWGLYQQLSAWRMTKGLKGFKTQNKDHVNDDMARRNHMRNKDKIAEGYYPMGKKASYSDAIPTVKIVIEHSRVIEEGEKRYRNINKIFLENQEGERYLLDTKKPGVARVYARHIAEGGKVNDDRWNHVHSLCEEYSKMAGFVRATRNGQFNESAQSLVNEGIAHYQSLRESLSRMTGKRGYNAYFESWTPPLMEDGTEENNLNELFVQETLDPRIESVMPILNRIHKKVSESVVDKEMNKLAEWADSLTEEESIKSNNPVGIPEEAHSSDFFMDIVDNHDGDVRGIMHDLRSLGLHSEIIKFCQWAREQGIADIFEAMKLAKKIDLENDDENEMAYEGYLRAIELLGPSEVDEAIHTGAALQKYKDNRFAPQNEPAKPAPEKEVEESALQAYLGDKKYGEKGMEALRNAGRKHVGKAKMQKIRAQFSKKEKAVSEEVDTGQYDAVKPISNSGTTPEQEKEFRKKVQAYGKELDQRQKEKEKGVAEGILGSDPNRGQKVPHWAKRGIVGKIGQKLDPAWSDVQMTVPQHLLSKQSSVPATNSPATKDMTKAASVTPTRAIPQNAGTKPSVPVTKNVAKTIADKQGVEEASHEEQVASLAAYNERMAGENPPIDLGLREVGNWAKVGHYGDPIKTAWYNIAKYGIRNNKFNDSVDRAMTAIGEFPDKYDLSIPEIDTLYSAYETVYDQWEQSRGAANENFINQADQAVVSEEDEMAEGVLDAIKRGVAGAKQFGKEVKDATKQAWDEEIPKLKQDWKNPIKTAFAEEGEMDEGTHTQHDSDLNPDDYERPPTDWSTDPIEAGTDRIHQKISSMLKKLSKPKDNQDLDEAAAPWEDEADKEDDKKPNDKKGSDGANHDGHSRAKHLAKQAIPKEKEEVKEGQDDLDRILQIMNHRR